jgi:hypothetical protein
LASRFLENIPLTTHIGSRRQLYFNPGKEVSLTIRIYDRGPWEYGNGGKFSSLVFQETGGISSEFCRAFAKEGVKRRFVVLDVSVGNMLPVSVQVDQNHQAM